MTRITVCEIDFDCASRKEQLMQLLDHSAANKSDVLLLPEFSFCSWTPEFKSVNEKIWCEQLELVQEFFAILADSPLAGSLVIGSIPLEKSTGRYNEAFAWDGTLRTLRSKRLFPEEEGWWEETWFNGRSYNELKDPTKDPFPYVIAICSELWSCEILDDCRTREANLLFTPLATPKGESEIWISLGITQAMRYGVFSVSSNRVSRAMGGNGWVISPAGEVIARTTPTEPWITVEVDLTDSVKAKSEYPCYLFNR